MLVQFAVRLSDKSSPVIHPSQLRQIAPRGDCTFTALFQQLSEDGTFESSSFDIGNKSLQSIEISGLKQDNSGNLTLIVVDFNSSQSLYFNQFLTVRELKFIFRLRVFSSPKIFNCPIHGHIK